MPIRDMQALYAELNAKFFGGRLPRYRVVVTSQVQSGLQGHCDEKRKLIRLRRTLPSVSLRRTLLHEMCHIGTSGHGRAFCDKLLELAAQGETWAKREAVYFGEWNWKQARLYFLLHGIAVAFVADAEVGFSWTSEAFWGRLVRGFPKFPAVVQFCAATLGMTPRRLLGFAPNLRTAWRRRIWLYRGALEVNPRRSRSPRKSRAR